MSPAKVTVADLIERGLLKPGEKITYRTQRYGLVEATLEKDGGVRLPDGYVCKTLSMAAKLAAGIESADGWVKWRVKRTGETLAEVRERA